MVQVILGYISTPVNVEPNATWYSYTRLYISTSVNEPNSTWYSYQTFSNRLLIFQYLAPCLTQTHTHCQIFQIRQTSAI